MHSLSRIALALSLTLCFSCGQQGDLYLPETDTRAANMATAPTNQTISAIEAAEKNA